MYNENGVNTIPRTIKFMLTGEKIIKYFSNGYTQIEMRKGNTPS
jgi:hypothetical protein